MTSKNIYPVIRPMWALQRRVRYHMQSGKMLHGLKFDAIGKTPVRGVKDMPLLQWLSISEQENRSVGGASAPNKLGSGSKVDVYEVRFELSTNIDYGPFRDDPTGADANKPGLCEWAALIRDALETDEQGNVDPKLNDMLVRPMTFEIEDAGTTQLAWACTLRVDLWTQLYAPGKRSCLA